MGWDGIIGVSYVVQRMLSSLYCVSYVVQSMWCELRGVSCVVLRGVSYVVQSTWCKLCGAIYAVQTIAIDCIVTRGCNGAAATGGDKRRRGGDGAATSRPDRHTCPVP